jgi:hypothetical protein
MDAGLGKAVKEPTSLKVSPGLIKWRICSRPDVEYFTAFNVPD